MPFKRKEIGLRAWRCGTKAAPCLTHELYFPLLPSRPTVLMSLRGERSRTSEFMTVFPLTRRRPWGIFPSKAILPAWQQKLFDWAEKWSASPYLREQVEGARQTTDFTKPWVSPPGRGGEGEPIAERVRQQQPLQMCARLRPAWLAPGALRPCPRLRVAVRI